MAYNKDYIPSLMSIYLGAQIAVYKHLLDRHNQDPAFRFSMRKDFSGHLSQGIGPFVGTANSGCFAFTLWDVPLGFPGVDLLEYYIRVKDDDTFQLEVEITVPRELSADTIPDLHHNTALSRGLVTELACQHWPQKVVWKEASTDEVLRLSYHVRNAYSDVPALLTALSKVLDETVPGIDEAIERHVANTPGWVGSRYTEEQFSGMRAKIESHFADLLIEKSQTGDDKVGTDAGEGLSMEDTSDDAEGATSANRSLAAPYTMTEAENDLFLTTAQIEHLRVALKRKKNLIVQGPPGVGKTFVARRLAWLQIGMQDDSRLQLVQFHQSYGYEDFIRGWRPTENGGFALTDGVFFEFVIRAQGDPNHEYFFIIDEINRGNLSKIFGELLLLLEADKRSKEYAVPLTYRHAKEPAFYLPPNLYVIGTMNTADRSLALVDYALRRRFTFVDLVPMLGEKLTAHLTQAGIPVPLAEAVIGRVKELNQQIKKDRNLGSGFFIGHSYLCVPLDGEGPEGWWKAIVDHDIAPLLREYWFDDQERAAKAIATLHE